MSDSADLPSPHVPGCLSAHERIGYLLPAMPTTTRAAVARRACEILAELYPGTRWEARSPDVRSRLETAPAAGELELLGAAPDDPRAILGGDVARPASGGADKHRLDTSREQAA